MPDMSDLTQVLVVSLVAVGAAVFVGRRFFAAPKQDTPPCANCADAGNSPKKLEVRSQK